MTPKIDEEIVVASRLCSRVSITDWCNPQERKRTLQAKMHWEGQGKGKTYQQQERADLQHSHRTTLVWYW